MGSPGLLTKELPLTSKLDDHMSIQQVINDCGLSILRTARITGRDINNAYCLYGEQANYFLKINDAQKYPGMFAKEARCLDVLRNAGKQVVPKLVKHCVVDGMQYLVLEWLDKGIATGSTWHSFGSSLALMHRHEQPYFGWEEDNYIGSFVQTNTVQPRWEDFYRECRIMPLARLMVDSGLFSKKDMQLAESCCDQAKELFPQEAPALLHGDLWSGNFLITATGGVALFDPASYYGHREMDIGMCKLFGGFPALFYSSYQETHPLDKGWEERLPLTQLYPILVHALLFGGHYVSGAREIIKRFGKDPGGLH